MTKSEGPRRLVKVVKNVTKVTNGELQRFNVAEPMNLQPTVLIVDDEKHTRDGLRSLLENDYDVYVAPDIAGAINVLDHEQVDVLLTDLRLGSEHGMTLIESA